MATETEKDGEGEMTGASPDQGGQVGPRHHRPGTRLQAPVTQVMGWVWNVPGWLALLSEEVEPLHGSPVGSRFHPPTSPPLTCLSLGLAASALPAPHWSSPPFKSSQPLAGSTASNPNPSPGPPGSYAANPTIDQYPHPSPWQLPGHFILISKISHQG